MRRRGPALAAALIGVLATAGTAFASHLAIDTEGHTTLDQILSPTNDPEAGYTTLQVEDVDENYLVRDGASEGSNAIPDAQSGREQRRRSLTYFSQMTDFQLADEESPARVEFLDQPGGAPGPSSAHRPWEALGGFMIDHSIRQLNRFVAASPVPQGDGTANSMGFSLMTGDQADNQHRNETLWVRDLLEGNGSINFNSGLTNAAAYTDPETLSKPSCSAFLASKGGDAGAAAAEGARYTGVQDYDDYPAGEGPNPSYYDPDDVIGQYATDGWPTYNGLMDAAQTTDITAAGLDVPFYVTNGNHDVLAQGNEDAIQAFEDIGTGCGKVLVTTAGPGAGLGDLLSPANASVLMLVPPDEQRQYVSKPQIKSIFAANDPVERHGFGFVDPDENDFSNGSASYYAWDPPQAPGFRFISVDTNSEGGVVGESSINPVAPGSSDGNIDDPQFEWLKRELDAAQLAGKLIVLYGHHPVRSMESVIPDEAAAPCTTDDEHGHDVNPGCDLDPRDSQPLHFGDPEAAPPGNEEQTFTELVAKYPNVLAYVAGHTHENKVIPFEKQDDAVWWEINTSAVVDHPQQHRLIEVMDNRDGTLSIFGTVLDHASPATAPPECTASCDYTPAEMASIGRTLSFNDFQSGRAATDGEAEGTELDQNVELLLGDPKSLECKGQTVTIVGSQGGDEIKGTPGKDVVLAQGGSDKVKTGPGKDVVCGGNGDDKIKLGKGADQADGDEGKDKLKGRKGRDTLKGKNGRDKLKGAKGRDKLKGGKGRDKLKGGKGRDKLKGGKGKDTLKGGKGGDKLKGGKGKDRCKGGKGRDRKSSC
jgi:3',5'-cyclic AMP phosphodiesterase CpdA